MKLDQFVQEQEQKHGSAPRPTPLAAQARETIDFTPSADEVARKAYFAYVNQGSQPGQDVQHWLEAEAELISERNLTRVHGYHNHT